MQPRERVPQRIALGRRRHERFDQDVASRRRQRMNRLTNLRVLDRLQDFTRLDLGHRTQGRAHVALVLLELPLEFPLDVATVLLR